jgi:hypothetical protein
MMFVQEVALSQRNKRSDPSMNWAFGKRTSAHFVKWPIARDIRPLYNRKLGPFVKRDIMNMHPDIRRWQSLITPNNCGLNLFDPNVFK